MLKISNEPNNANQTNTDVIRDDDEENQAPKVVIKKKTKKKKQIPQVNPTETTTDSAAVLNTSSNRTSTTGYKYHVNRSIFFSKSILLLLSISQPKLSSKWSAGKRISGIGAGKTSAIRKVICRRIKCVYFYLCFSIDQFARPSNDRQNRGDSRTLIRNKPSVTSSANRLSQEQREQLARAAEERKQEERKRKIEKCK